MDFIEHIWIKMTAHNKKLQTGRNVPGFLDGEEDSYLLTARYIRYF